ncbi:unnamed protein product, partial [Porites evermanni]
IQLEQTALKDEIEHLGKGYPESSRCNAQATTPAIALPSVRAEGNSCQRCKSDHHLVRDCSFRTKQTLEERKASSKASTYVSNVSMEIRKRAHVFKACRGDHAMADCKLTSSS